MSLRFACCRQEAPRGFEPGMKVLQTSGRHDVSTDKLSTSRLITNHPSLNLPLREEIPADLGEIVDAWTELPDAIKAGVLAVVKATKKLVVGSG
jgi:hypothetical protein